MGRLIIAMALLLGACTPNGATLTLVNSSPKEIKVTVDEHPSLVRAGGFVNLPSLKSGQHYVKIGNAQTQPIILESRRTTVLDLSGESCYVVADYTPQYEHDTGGAVLIEERFKKQPMFTTREPMTVVYGEPLPRKVDIGIKVRRLHTVDCSMIEVDRAILEAVSRMP